MRTRASALFTAVAVALVAACNASPESDEPLDSSRREGRSGLLLTATGNFLITPDALEFGNVQTDSTSPQQSVTVTNVSTAAVVVSMAGGAPGAPFNGAQNCQGTTLDPGASCQISYTFAPTSAGEFSATSAGTINDQPFSIALHGTGVAPSFLVTPTALDFGDVTVGSTSAQQSVTVTNAGAAPVTVSMTGGAPGTPFNGSQNCQGNTLAPGASCQIFYTFSPTASGPATAHSIGAINGQAFDVALQGSGAPPHLSITPTALEFGEVSTGTTSAQQSVTVTNAGAAPVTVSMTGGAPGAPFNGSQNCQGNTLAPGASCQIFYTFSPEAAGELSATSSGTINGVPFDVALHGTGIPPGTSPSAQFLITPVGLDFGEVQVGTTSTQQIVTATNVGSTSVVVSMTGGAPGAPFNGAQNCQGNTLAPGASCQIFYTFSPTQAGTFDAASVGTINGQAFDVALHGTGLPPRFLVTPAGLDFGKTAIGSTSPQQRVTVTNVGFAPVTVSMTGGAPGAPFNGSQNCQGSTLAPGASCQIFYTFSPTQAGTFDAASVGTINGQAFDVALHGVGAPPTFLVTPVGLEFGGVAIGGTSPEQIVTVTNVGTSPVTVSMTGGAPGAPFNGAQNCQGNTLAPGASCQIFYTFSPTDAGPATASSIGAVNGQPFNIALSGTGIRTVYQVLAFDPPLGVKPFYVAGETAPARFAVADGDGTRLVDAEAAALAADCLVRVRFSGTPSPICASYDAEADRFSALVRVPLDAAPGTHTITAEVVQGPDVFGSSIDIVVRARGP